MGEILKRQPLEKGQTYFFSLIFYGIVTMAFFSIAEFGARFRGITPWNVPTDVNVRVEPGGSFFSTHPRLGYTHLPGQFTVTLPATSYSFHVTHLDTTLRVTHDLRTYDPEQRKDEIWIFGCSFTHGWSLNDEETYPWLLQERFPQYEIVNFGVNGYGTLQSLLQFQEALTQKNPPKTAIIAYAPIHDQRSTFLRIWQKNVAAWNQLDALAYPYARVNREGKLVSSLAKVEFREFPFMRNSAFAHFIEQTYNRLEERWYDSHQITKAIIKEFAELAEKHHVTLIVAGIIAHQNTEDMLEYAASLGAITGDVSVDLNIRENTNLPHDGHPSASANVQYAKNMEPLLFRGIKKNE